MLRAGCQFVHNALIAVLESLAGMVRDLTWVYDYEFSTLLKPLTVPNVPGFRQKPRLLETAPIATQTIALGTTC